jgi:L-alanine-DL-glutamate epimerase-like enolase superfamily enzyme
MARASDIRVTAARLHFLPVQTRVPLKFGPETLDAVTCARVRVRVEDRRGRSAEGWGETPLSVQWVWPSTLPYEPRHAALRAFCRRLTRAWTDFGATGHPLELGWDFQEGPLRRLLMEVNAGVVAPAAHRGAEAPTGHGESTDESAAARQGEPLPWLAALVCCSPFDLAIHDAYGRLLDRPVYATYGGDLLNRDLADLIEPAAPDVSFRGRHPADYLARSVPARLWAWHLVGGLDPLEPVELTGHEPRDGHPVLLRDWIRTDGLKCLKVKLRGTDAAWDFARLTAVGRIADAEGVEWLSADFNCTVTDPAYVTDMLDRLRFEQPRIHDLILYVEQPFPHDLEAHRLDVRSVSARKPLFLDESAHDWRLIRLGRELGWTGVALKTCKTQTGALLSACWARAHGMSLMVQDLTNPMLAQIPHVQLAAQTGTIMGVETNAMQFYPAASAPEAAVHPGLYCRRNGEVDLSSIRGPGFGYRWEEIRRTLPAPAAESGG